MPSIAETEWVLFDAGIFIGGLLRGDPRYTEARTLVEAARRGDLPACTTVGILSEVYAALTWAEAKPPHSPEEASEAVRLLVAEPSAIRVLNTGVEAALRMLELVVTHQLTARRTHDARHAATALTAGVLQVCTYDIDDWKVFRSDGLRIVGPPSVLSGTKLLTEEKNSE